MTTDYEIVFFSKEILKTIIDLIKKIPHGEIPTCLKFPYSNIDVDEVVRITGYFF